MAILFVLLSLQRLKGTTLVAPAQWAIGSLLLISITESLLSWTAPTSASTWRYLAAISSLCPTMAILGAKRPQDRGWQFIVASLWIVLALPAAQDLAFSRGGTFELHPAWRWFLLILMGIGLSNQLPTRFWIAALLTSGAQLVLLGDQLPILHALKWQRSHVVALPMITAAIVLAWLQSHRKRSGFGWDHVWLDFRDQFGAVWALRVVERVNHAARMHGWSTRLSWRGFLADDQHPDASIAPDVKLGSEMELSVRTLLRRFVSPDWIEARLSHDNSNEEL